MTLCGLYVPLITPFDETGAVAKDALEAVAHQILAAGATGLVALGTTGEPSALTRAEQQVVVEIAARACKEHSAHLVVAANSAPALTALRDRPETTAALTLVPPFVRPGEAGVLAYFEHLVATSPVPIVVYHVAYRTGQPLSAAAMRRLAELPGIAGMKYAAGGIDEETVLLMADLPPDFAVLGGDDLFISPMLALGAHGGILASGLAAAQAFADLIRAWQTGDTSRARQLGHQLASLSRALFAAPNPTIIKAVLHARGGIPTPAVRLPLVPPEPALVAAALAYSD